MKKYCGRPLFYVFLCVSVFAHPASPDASFKGVVSDIFNYRLDEAAVKLQKTNLKSEEKHYAQALYAMHKGLYGKAHDEMIKSGALPGDRWKVYIDGMADIAKGFESENIAGFIVRLYGRDKVLLPYLRKTLPKINKSMRRRLGFRPDGVVLEIYPDSEKFLQASTLSEDELERSGTVAIAKFSRLMILSPRLLPYGYRWSDTVCHEYVHHIIGNFTGMDIPLYLNEGLARTFETLWRKPAPELEPSVKSVLARAKDEGFIEFKEFERGMPSLKNQKDVALAFAEVNYLVYSMFADGSAKKIKKMLLGCGESGFEKSFGECFAPVDEYMASYWKKVKNNEWTYLGAVPDFIYWGEDGDEFLSLSIKDHMRLGDRLRKRRKYALALAQYAKAEKLEPENVLVLIKTAKTLVSAGDRKKAGEYFEKAAAVSPDDFVCLVSRADFFIAGGECSRSVPLILKALERNPFYRKGYEQLCDIYTRTGKKKKAAEFAAFLDAL
ncbi:MAG: hypothetical protein U9O97_07410 [Elusimicrobiota bacterium]|nr:hypothetical protein [Elusimicrobiota bacterium]